MQLNPAEISELIKSRIQGLAVSADIRNEGTVVSVTDGICRVHGLSEAMQGETDKERLRSEIADLKRDLAAITKTLSDRGIEFIEELRRRNVAIKPGILRGPQCKAGSGFRSSDLFDDKCRVRRVLHGYSLASS